MITFLAGFFSGAAALFLFQKYKPLDLIAKIKNGGDGINQKPGGPGEEK